MRTRGPLRVGLTDHPSAIERAHTVRPYNRFTNTTNRHGGICGTSASETTSKFRGQVVARQAKRQRTPIARSKTGVRSRDTIH